MKKNFFLTFIFISLFTIIFPKADEIKSVVKIQPKKKLNKKIKTESEIESIIKINPEIKYNPNLKYEQIDKYTLPEEKKNENKFDFGFDININQEEKAIEYWKIDVKTNF